MKNSLVVKKYSTRVVPVPAKEGSVATTKLVCDFSAAGEGVSINVVGADPSVYPVSTYGAGKTISQTL